MFRNLCLGALSTWLVVPALPMRSWLSRLFELFELFLFSLSPPSLAISSMHVCKICQTPHRLAVTKMDASTDTRMVPVASTVYYLQKSRSLPDLREYQDDPPKHTALPCPCSDETVSDCSDLFHRIWGHVSNGRTSADFNEQNPLQGNGNGGITPSSAFDPFVTTSTPMTPGSVPVSGNPYSHDPTAAMGGAFFASQTGFQQPVR